MKNTFFLLFLTLSTTLFSQKIEINSSCEVTYKVVDDTLAIVTEQNDISQKFLFDLDKKNIEMFYLAPDGNWVRTYYNTKIKDFTINFKKRNGGFIEVFCPDVDKILVVWLVKFEDDKYQLYTYWKNENLFFNNENLIVNFK
jgi:hypothetical protein